MPIDNALYNHAGDTWWDESHCLGMMRTALNPGRFAYFREVLTQRLGWTLQGTPTLDVGCGGGLLAEEFARLGCAVTGIDPSEPSLATARAHAQQAGLTIAYRAGAGEALPFADAAFDLVYCCDVLEHVSDLNAVIGEIARVLRPGGVFCYDTLNRTLRSKLVAIKLFQEWRYTSFMPPCLHDWALFIKPQELLALLGRHGLQNRDLVGLKPQPNPLQLLRLLRRHKRGVLPSRVFARSVAMQRSNDISVFYMGYAQKPTD